MSAARHYCGTIYDRHGRVIAENSVGHEVLLMPGNRRDMAATLERLRPLLRLTGTDVAAAWRAFRSAPALPLVGVRDVVGPGGTAWLSRLQGWDFMGKTGTAQNAHGADHAWFAGIGGAEGGDPEIVAVALVYAGGHGWVASEPVANPINFYLSRKHGRAVVRHPVPRVRQMLGLPIDWEWLQSPVE